MNLRFWRKQPPVTTPHRPVFAIVLGRVYGSDNESHAPSIAYGNILLKKWMTERGGQRSNEYGIVIGHNDSDKLRGIYRPVVRVHGEPSQDVMMQLAFSRATFDKISHR